MSEEGGARLGSIQQSSMRRFVIELDGAPAESLYLALAGETTVQGMKGAIKDALSEALGRPGLRSRVKGLWHVINGRPSFIPSSLSSTSIADVFPPLHYVELKAAVEIITPDTRGHGAPRAGGSAVGEAPVGEAPKAAGSKRPRSPAGNGGKKQGAATPRGGVTEAGAAAKKAGSTPQPKRRKTLPPTPQPQEGHQNKEGDKGGNSKQQQQQQTPQQQAKQQQQQQQKQKQKQKHEEEKQEQQGQQVQVPQSQRKRKRSRKGREVQREGSQGSPTGSPQQVGGDNTQPPLTTASELNELVGGLVAGLGSDSVQPDRAGGGAGVYSPHRGPHRAKAVLAASHGAATLLLQQRQQQAPAPEGPPSPTPAAAAADAVVAVPTAGKKKNKRSRKGRNKTPSAAAAAAAAAVEAGNDGKDGTGATVTSTDSGKSKDSVPDAKRRKTVPGADGRAEQKPTNSSGGSAGNGSGKSKHTGSSGSGSGSDGNLTAATPTKSGQQVAGFVEEGNGGAEPKPTASPGSGTTVRSQPLPDSHPDLAGEGAQDEPALWGSGVSGDGPGSGSGVEVAAADVQPNAVGQKPSEEALAPSAKEPPKASPGGSKSGEKANSGSSSDATTNTTSSTSSDSGSTSNSDKSSDSSSDKSSDSSSDSGTSKSSSEGGKQTASGGSPAEVPAGNAKAATCSGSPSGSSSSSDDSSNTSSSDESGSGSSSSDKSSSSSDKSSGDSKSKSSSESEPHGAVGSPEPDFAGMLGRMWVDVKEQRAAQQTSTGSTPDGAAVGGGDDRAPRGEDRERQQRALGMALTAEAMAAATPYVPGLGLKLADAASFSGSLAALRSVTRELIVRYQAAVPPPKKAARLGGDATPAGKGVTAAVQRRAVAERHAALMGDAASQKAAEATRELAARLGDDASVDDAVVHVNWSARRVDWDPEARPPWLPTGYPWGADLLASKRATVEDVYTKVKEALEGLVTEDARTLKRGGLNVDGNGTA